MDWIDKEDSTSFGRIQIEFSNRQFISLSNYLSEYETGAMHGMFGTIGIHYWLNPLRPFDLFSLINNKELFIKRARDLVHNALMEKARTEYEEDRRNSFYVYDDGLLPIEENFSKYYFTKTEMVFIYNPYDITAWSEGMHLVKIRYGELLQSFTNEVRFSKFITSLINVDS
jgi:hypothetical protein